MSAGDREREAREWTKADRDKKGAVAQSDTDKEGELRRIGKRVKQGTWANRLTAERGRTGEEGRGTQPRQNAKRCRRSPGPALGANGGSDCRLSRRGGSTVGHWEDAANCPPRITRARVGTMAQVDKTVKPSRLPSSYSGLLPPLRGWVRDGEGDGRRARPPGRRSHGEGRASQGSHGRCVPSREKAMGPGEGPAVERATLARLAKVDGWVTSTGRRGW